MDTGSIEYELFLDWFLSTFTPLHENEDDQALRAEALYRFESLSREDATAAARLLLLIGHRYVRLKHFFEVNLVEVVLLFIAYLYITWAYYGTTHFYRMSAAAVLFILTLRVIFHVQKGLMIKRIVKELIVSSSHGIKLEY